MKNLYRQAKNVRLDHAYRSRLKRVRGCATSYTRFEIDGLVLVFLSFHYSGMHKKVTQRVGWVENPTSPQAV